MSVQYQAVGRRKTSVARVTLKPGEGLIIVNGQDVNEYMPYATLVQDLEQPLVATEQKGKFDIAVNVKGGGFNGQAGAIRLGITRALIEVNADWKPVLKELKLTTRDARKVERKKYGFKKSRKSPQFSKR